MLSKLTLVPDKGWYRAFDDPIPVPDGRVLKTLHDAGHYTTSLPKAVQEPAEWQTAAEMLILAAQAIRARLRLGLTVPTA